MTGTHKTGTSKQYYKVQLKPRPGKRPASMSVNFYITFENFSVSEDNVDEMQMKFNRQVAKVVLPLLNFERV